MLNKFARVMCGTKIFIELLREIASINKLNEFYIVINHQDYNYRIKAIYTEDLEKLKYPKNFRKTVYNAEPLSNVMFTCNDKNSSYYEQEYEAFKYRRDWNGCLCYNIKIYEASASATEGPANADVYMYQDNEALESIKDDLEIKEMPEGNTSRFVMKYKLNKYLNSFIYNY